MTPGDVIREQLDRWQMTETEFAVRMGYSLKHISQVLNGHARCRPTFALACEHVLGIPMRDLMQLQADIDLAIVRAKLERPGSPAGDVQDVQSAGEVEGGVEQG